MQKQTKDKLKKAVPLTVGSSMLILTLMPAASAFAATAPITNVQAHVMPNGRLTASSNHQGYLVDYQFLAKYNGSWHIIRKYEHSWHTNWTPPTGAKNVEIQVNALTEWAVAHKDWSRHMGSKPVAEGQQVASLSISGAPTSNIGTNTAENLSVVAKDAAGNVVSNPGTAKWSVSGTGATVEALANGGAVFNATAAGSYTVTATLDGKTATSKITVYGAPAAVKLTPASSSLVADGSATDTVTATVVDANGNTVADYSGTATIGDSVSPSLISTTGQPSDFSVVGSADTLTFTNGVATFNVGPTTSVGLSDTITLTPPASTGFAAATTTITAANPQVTGLAVALGSTSAQDLAANSQSHVTVDVSTTDGQGNVTGSAAGTYATVTLSGPGSLVSGSTPSDAVKSETIYIPAGSSGGTTPVTVYSIVGETGDVTVSATSSGLQSGSTTIPSYLVGAPASLNVKTSTGTDSNGNPYTLYTVSVVDSNGQAVPNATGSITVSNNAVAQGGTVSMGTVSSSGVFTPGQTTFNISNGVATFAVENAGTTGTNPVTLTITDGTLPQATASYDFTAGAATQLLVTPSNSSYYTVKPGQTVTFSAQVADAYNNPVAGAGVPVTFNFLQKGGFTTFPNGLTQETVDTNANGVASVTFTVPSNASGTTPLEVSAASTGLTTADSAAVNIESATNSTAYATSVSLTNGSSGAVTSLTDSATNTGSAIATTINANALNAVGQDVTGNDTFQITSSNPNVAAVTTEDVNSTKGTANIASDITVGMAGSATITVKDISNPSMPSASFAVNVTPGTASQVTYEYNGAPIATTGLNVNANTPVLLTVVNSDSAGDPIPVTGSTPLTVDVSTTAPNAELLGQIGGGPISSVQIQPGATSATVYLESSQAETVIPKELSATTTSSLSAPAGLTATTGSAGSTTVGLSWTAVTGAKSYDVYTSTDGGTTWSAATNVTSPSYTYTGTKGGQSVEFKVTAVDTYGSQSTGATTTGTTPAAAATTITAGTPSATTEAAGTPVTITYTVTDQYGNAVSGLTPTASVSATGTEGTDTTADATSDAGTATVAAGSTAGQYVVTVTPGTNADGDKDFTSTVKFSTASSGGISNSSVSLTY